MFENICICIPNADRFRYRLYGYIHHHLYCYSKLKISTQSCFICKNYVVYSVLWRLANNKYSIVNYSCRELILCTCLYALTQKLLSELELNILIQKLETINYQKYHAPKAIAIMSIYICILIFV